MPDQVMRAWKMVDADHAGALAAGSVKIGTAAAYSDLESKRRDPLDSGLQYTVGSAVGGSPEVEAMTQRHFRSSNVGLMINVRRRHFVEPRYVLCLSAPGCRHDEEPETAKAIFRIADVYRLAWLLTQQNRDRLFAFDIRQVKYASREFDAFDPVEYQPSSFIKGETFRPEQEIRIVWLPARPIKQPFFITDKSPAVAELFSAVDQQDVI
jgi:hypothetical protein